MIPEHIHYQIDGMDVELTLDGKLSIGEINGGDPIELDLRSTFALYLFFRAPWVGALLDQAETLRQHRQPGPVDGACA